MGFFSNWSFLRDRDGNTTYTQHVTGQASWNSMEDKVQVAHSSPIVMASIQLLAGYFSRVRFAEKGQEDTPLIQLLEKPNIYESKDDFLRKFIWYKYSGGFTYIRPIEIIKGTRDIKRVKFLYNLKPSLIEFPEDFNSKLPETGSEAKQELDKEFWYDRYGQNMVLKFRDIMPFYDLANGLQQVGQLQNNWVSPSRLDALREPITNITKAFAAKNIVISSNGKEMFINKTAGKMATIPLSEKEQRSILRRLNTKIGLGVGRDRSIMTNSDIAWQSLHIKLRELGLDESVISDSITILTAFGIPPELINVNGSSSTFENQAKAIINFVQSRVQVDVNDFCSTLNARYGTKLEGTFDHLPIMRENEKSKALSMKSIMSGLKQMVDNGILTAEEAKQEYLDWKSKM